MFLHLCDAFLFSCVTFRAVFVGVGLLVTKRTRIHRVGKTGHKMLYNPSGGGWFCIAWMAKVLILSLSWMVLFQWSWRTSLSFRRWRTSRSVWGSWRTSHSLPSSITSGLRGKDELSQIIEKAIRATRSGRAWDPPPAPHKLDLEFIYFASFILCWFLYLPWIFL